MLAASAYLAWAFLGHAASSSHDTFRYVISSSVRQVQDVCQLCYADDCLDIDPLRCEYFEEMNEISAKDEPVGPGSEVDDMISELTEQATMSWWSQKCIPVVSYYTSCNKENLCLGCESCRCTTDGTWQCGTIKRCRNEQPLDVNHRTLFSAVENLLESEKTTRKKRSVASDTKKESNQISMVDIAEWMYGVTPNINKQLNRVTDVNNDIENVIDLDTVTENSVQRYNVTDTATVTIGTITTSTKPTAKFSTQTESEYLGFEEVLNNISNDQINKRRKSQLHEDDDTFDYMEINDITPPEYNNSENFMKLLNDLEDGNSITQTTTDGKFVIDLYPREKTSDYDTGADAADIFNSLVNNTIEDNDKINLMPEEIEINPVNIMKRDVSYVPTAHTKIIMEKKGQGTTSPTVTNNIHTTTVDDVDKGNDLKNSVLLPLTNIIDEKQNELKELFQIRENLIRIMTVYYNSTKPNITAETKITNETDTHFSVYKLDLYPEIHGNLRRINPNVTEKLLYKLKRDIYEVFKDIARFQRLSRNQTIPNDLKTLIRAMKYYVTKQEGIDDSMNKKAEHANNTGTRRFYMRRVESEPKSIARQLVDILNVLDKDSSPRTFSKLSKSSKKLIKRVIKYNFVDDISPVGYRVFDPEYSLTGDLRTIGKSWAILTAKLANSSPHQKLYALKLLHFTLSGDMNKITDAITLVDFAHSRRMSPIETPLAEEVMDRINTGLLSIKSKVQTLMKYQNAQERAKLEDSTKIKKKKKESFFRRIRNMLRGSKQEIIDMAKKKVPKSEIFKTIAKKKLQELARNKLADDENTMLKWQKKLRVTRRKKRDLKSHMKNLKNRMKNIIPQYLRGKIDPAIAKHNTKRQDLKQKKANQQNHYTKTSAKPDTMMSSTNQATFVTNTAVVITSSR